VNKWPKYEKLDEAHDAEGMPFRVLAHGETVITDAAVVLSKEQYDELKEEA